ncbi:MULTISPECIES: S41 family peptidase [Fusobacterium]|jgi:carboxyl-terminal processing protease|uniref:S41 family peptidase n=1 Tax=Fusobacterium hominis TaxID=2764326 RepID=A0A7G9GUP7_9FUSO|nr:MULTISPECIES: S41 family peptidase [Fusobacterium]QNM14529.1 S41 family peptidase [Fusobacterium hominis]
MKNLLKKKWLITLLSVGIFISTFGAEAEKKPEEKKETPKVEKTGFLSNIRQLKELSDIMDVINQNYVGDKPIDKKLLMQGALKGMVESLEDPHSNYFTSEELKDFQEDIKGKYVGVGMVVQKRPNEALTVVSPIEDSPAYKAGMKPKDKIIAIDGQPTYKLTSEECVKKLKGKENTTVKVTVIRDGVKDPKDIEIKRAVVELKYVKSRMVDTKNKIGYLRLTQFGENVYPDVAKALEGLQAQGMKALIFDVRSNPGGALDQAVKITSMFIKDGKIVSVKSKDGEEKVSNREGKFYGDFPLVVLVNGGSASASEILAGAIKDDKRGILIGEKTFGKGSVQTLVGLPDGDGIKLTIAKYYTPSGVCIHGVGIEPDVKVEEKDGYMLFDSMVTNIDEKQSKENKKEIIKEIKGEKEAEEFEKHKDIQLDTAIGILKGILLNKK